MANNIVQQLPQKFLCLSKNGVKVFYAPNNPHLSTHLADTPGLDKLVVEAINKLNLDGNLFAGDIDMGRIVGTCDVIEVSGGDKIVFGIRKNRFAEGLVPFVKNRAAETSTFVSLLLEPNKDGTYELGTAWIGEFEDEPFPLAPNANDKSKDYWNKYAFVYGSQEIEPGTETPIKPW
jgi:hypothetical protein